MLLALTIAARRYGLWLARALRLWPSFVLLGSIHRLCSCCDGSCGIGRGLPRVSLFWAVPDALSCGDLGFMSFWALGLSAGFPACPVRWRGLCRRDYFGFVDLPHEETYSCGVLRDEGFALTGLIWPFSVHVAPVLGACLPSIVDGTGSLGPGTVPWRGCEVDEWCLALPFLFAGG